MKRKRGARIPLLFVVALIVGIGGLVYYFFFKSNHEVVPAFAEGRLNLVIEDHMITTGPEPRIVDEELLLPLEIIKEYIDPDIYWDDALQKITVTTRDKVIRMKTDSLNAFVNNKPVTLNIPAVVEQGIVYIPIEFLSEFYKIDIIRLVQHHVVIIDFKNHLLQAAEPIKSNAVVRTGRSKRYPILRHLNAEDSSENSLRIFEEYDKWYKVRTAMGEVGYIEKRFVKVKSMLVERVPEEIEYPWKPIRGKINLAWDRLVSHLPELTATGELEGLDIVSPDWLQVEDETGSVKSRATTKYVEWAHKNGYKVWALLKNDFTDMDKTSEFLKNTDARDNMIRELLAYAALLKLDGINIDFENMYEKDRDTFTQLVREMVPLLKEQGLVVSVDINTAKCYDRKALAEVVDYVVFMAYDQHWSGGPKVGPVAQIPWVEKLITQMLQDIPQEKFIMGIPFYTRLWKEDGSGSKPSTQHLTMEEVHRVILENSATVYWDDESGQFCAEYGKDGASYTMWFEDENSINLRASLVHKYKLAGLASWSGNYASPQAWTVLNENLKTIGSYPEWKQKNEGKEYIYPSSAQSAIDSER